MNCRQCSARVKKIGDYVPPTCGKSECQEAEFKANQERNKPKARRLRPKIGALKADGTPWTPREKLSANLHAAREERTAGQWTDQPGGIQKLEIRDGKDDPWFNNELQFARLIMEMMALVSVDDGQWTVMLNDLQKALGMTESQVTSIFMRASDVLGRNRGRS